MRKLLRAILPIAIVLPLLLLSWSVVARTANAANNPDWAGNPRIDGAGDLVIRLLNGSLKQPSHQGTVCAAEKSTTGNVQVNCLAEDNASPFHLSLPAAFLEVTLRFTGGTSRDRNIFIFRGTPSS